MEIDRAIEILNPEHREQYDSLATVQEACRMGMAALEKQTPVKLDVCWEMGLPGGTCPKCLNWVQRSYNYCPFCGQAVKWDG